MRCRICQCLGNWPCTCQSVTCLPVCELLSSKKHAGNKGDTRQPRARTCSMQLESLGAFMQRGVFKHSPSSPGLFCADLLKLLL